MEKLKIGALKMYTKFGQNSENKHQRKVHEPINFKISVLTKPIKNASICHFFFQSS